MLNKSRAQKKTYIKILEQKTLNISENNPHWTNPFLIVRFITNIDEYLKNHKTNTNP